MEIGRGELGKGKELVPQHDGLNTPMVVRHLSTVSACYVVHGEKQRGRTDGTDVYRII